MSIALPTSRTGGRSAVRPAPRPTARPAAQRGTRPDAGFDARPGLRPQCLSWLLVGLGLALLPWLVVLATSLPADATASHWSLAWTGLDALEAVGLISTGVLLRRGDPRHCLTAVATAALLLLDAWFDTTTAAPGGDFASALVMAVCVEIPLAFVCARLAMRSLPRQA